MSDSDQLNCLSIKENNLDKSTVIAVNQLEIKFYLDDLQNLLIQTFMMQVTEIQLQFW